MLTRPFVALILLSLTAGCSSGDFSTASEKEADSEEETGSTSASDESMCGDSVCIEGQICCQAPDPCADTCIVHCAEAGCPDTLTCNSDSGSCLPDMPSGSGGATSNGGGNMGGQSSTGGTGTGTGTGGAVTGTGGKPGGATCGATECKADQICCTEGMCAGDCVPNCNNVPCMADRVCNTTSGICDLL